MFKSLPTPSLATLGLVATTGATFGWATFGATPATASLLKFDFNTDNGSGNFILDTSADKQPNGINSNYYLGAITSFEYPFFGINVSEPVTMYTSFSPNSINFPPSSTRWDVQYGEFGEINFPMPTEKAFNLVLNLAGDLSNNLSENPTDYTLLDGALAGYGGFAGPNPLPEVGVGYDIIQNLSVSKVPVNVSKVPEPSSTLGLLALSTLGLGTSLLSRRKGDSSW
jgi:hypothetical protein